MWIEKSVGGSKIELGWEVGGCSGGGKEITVMGPRFDIEEIKSNR